MLRISWTLKNRKLFQQETSPVHWYILCCLAQHISTVDRQSPWRPAGTMSLSRLNLYSLQCFRCVPHSLPSLQQRLTTDSISRAERKIKVCLISVKIPLVFSFQSKTLIILCCGSGTEWNFTLTTKEEENCHYNKIKFSRKDIKERKMHTIWDKVLMSGTRSGRKRKLF